MKVDEINRLLESIWHKHDDADARRNFKNYRTQLEDVTHYADRIHTLIRAMLRDNRVDLRPYNEAEVNGGDYIYQCINAAITELQQAHTRCLTYYEDAVKKVEGDDRKV